MSKSKAAIDAANVSWNEAGCPNNPNHATRQAVVRAGRDYDDALMEYNALFARIQVLRTKLIQAESDETGSIGVTKTTARQSPAPDPQAVAAMMQKQRDAAAAAIQSGKPANAPALASVNEDPVAALVANNPSIEAPAPVVAPVAKKNGK
jgi:hypothetical protein